MTQRIFFENIKNGGVITDEMKEHAIAELEKLEQKENDKIKEKRRKIQDILVSLELGGTKAELDEMLKNLREEVAG